MNYSLFQKTLYLFLALYLYLNVSPAKAQEVYIRISERDCVNLYGSLFSSLLESPHQKDFKYLFPSKFKGKRFEQFNQLYFQNKVTLDQVTFSDTLYNLTEKPLNGFSGIAWIHNNQLLSVLGAETMVTQNVNLLHYVANLNNVTTLIDFQKEGLSHRLNIATSYKSNKFALSDYIYRNVYYWDNSKNQTTIDLKNDAFQEMLKNKLTNKQYADHLKYKDEVMKNGISYPVPFGLELSENQLALSYTIPFANLYNIATEGAKEQFIPVPMQLFHIAVIPLDSEKIDVNHFIDNSFTQNFTIGNPEYYTTTNMGIYNQDIYRLNQLVYNKEDWSKKRLFPLLNKTKNISENHSKNLVSQDIDGIENFSFQQDTLLNKNFFLDIEFNTVNENILLLNRPYAINIKTKKKYTLDWDSKVNTYYYPATYTYEQLQFWETATGFNVLVKKEEQYFLKSYNSEWLLLSEKNLPFYGKEVKNLRFTKNNVYVFTEDQIFNLSNTFES